MEKLIAVFKPIYKAIAPINVKIRKRNELEEKLSGARLTETIAPEEWLGFKEVLAVLFIIIGFIIGGTVFAIIGFVAAWILPDLWLKEQRDKYEKSILKFLPDALDLLTICVEAGLTFNAAVSKLVEIGKNSGLNSEFSRFLYEIRLGKSRKDALKDMSERVNIKEISSFISSVIQSEQLGTSLASTLRFQSEDVRLKRHRRAEKLALEAPIKLLFPLVAFIFPTTFLMIFGPVVLKFMQGF